MTSPLSPCPSRTSKTSIKLNCDILNSPLWCERDARDLLLTALLMAKPRKLTQPTPAIKVRSLEGNGFTVPPGRYGFVEAAGIGLIHRACVEQKPGLEALERLTAPDPDTLRHPHEGRRLARISGGFIILNSL